MSETLLMSATADVMLYEDSAKQWVRPGGNGSMATISNCGTPDMQKLSTVQLWQDCNKTVFRITAKRIYDGKILIEQTIFQKLKYQAATKCFHQWRSENRQVFGLSFSSEHDAEKFLLMVQQAMEYASSISDYHYSSVNANGNGTNVHYQEAWYQQQQSSIHCKEPDQDSIGSANGVLMNSTNINNSYRKSSYSVNAMNGINTISTANPAGLVQPQQQYSQYQHQQQTNVQRRASQGSSNSTTTNSSCVNNGLLNINSSQTNGTNGYHSNTVNMNHLNINGPTANIQPIQSVQNSIPSEIAGSSSTLSSVSVATPAPSASGIPPISNSAPPPPPPPPLSIKSCNNSKPFSFADQLKQAQLRNTAPPSAPVSTINRTSSLSGDTGIGSKSSTISSTNSGHSDLLSELAATINKRNKANVSSTLIAESAEKRANGDLPAVYRPWQKTNANAVTNINSVSTIASVDSPRAYRKAASGSSLSSQEESTIKNGVNNGSSSSAATTPTGVLTLNDLERFKQELIVELNKTKQEILDAVRRELAQHFEQK